jgi:hypothetical protein
LTELPASQPSPLAVGIPRQFLEREVLELARRVVAQLDSPRALALDMGLDTAQWSVLEHHPVYKSALAAAQAEANSAAGLADRVRLKAMVVLDRGGLLDMAQIINDAGVSAAARVGAFNAVMEAAGIAKQKDQTASQAGSGPLVVIHLPTSDGAPIIVGQPVEAAS